MLPADLHTHPLFRVNVEHLPTDERVALSYQRAKLVLQTHNLSLKDIETCSSRFWGLMSDPICILDIAMFTILAAHVGLAIGSLSRHVERRPDLRPLLNKLLRMDAIGLYLLTERGHGLDAFNIETTATKVDDGFILNTPREEASKFMPASTPAFRIPKVALVMARLIVDGEDRGSRFFIVPICNEREMYAGVSSTRLPPRSGSCPLDFSITRFDNIHLPVTALVSSEVGSGADLETPADPLAAWWNEIWRIQLGTMAVPAPWVSAIKAIAYIGGRYSMHRCLAGKRNEPTPIITFRTQQWPIVQATAVGMVMSNWFPRAVRQGMDNSIDHRIQHALAVIVKATVCRHFQTCVSEMAERLGAQGTFEQNYMARIENDGKGVIIAEGDILTLCIRLFSELLLERYSVPLPDPSESVLARHAHALLEENRTLLRNIGCDHRSDTFNNLILPQSQTVIEAMGHSLAYSAALKTGSIPQDVLDVYECVAISRDSAWYTECTRLTRMEQRMKEDRAITAMMESLPSHLKGLGIEEYVTAPIISDEMWKQYVKTLKVYRGDAVPEMGEFGGRGYEQMQASL